LLGLLPTKLETQELESSIGLTTIPAELDKIGLFRSHFQTVFPHTFGEGLVEPTGVCIFLEGTDKVVRVDAQICMPNAVRLHRILEPFHQNVVQINVGQNGLYNAPLAAIPSQGAIPSHPYPTIKKRMSLLKWTLMALMGDLISFW
jgi:hypothetical protein